MFPEALMLHYLDDLDSKMESMRAHFEREAGSDGAWTGYNSSLGRPLLNTAKFLEKKPEDDERPRLNLKPRWLRTTVKLSPGTAAPDAPVSICSRKKTTLAR